MAGESRSVPIRFPHARDGSSRAAHPQWCEGDVTAEFDGTEHVSRAHQWRPSYQYEVAVVDLLRQVVYRDGGVETPVAIVRIDNPTHSGEVAMTAEDLAAFVDRLLDLRAALIGEQPDTHGGVAGGPGSP